LLIFIIVPALLLIAGCGQKAATPTDEVTADDAQVVETGINEIPAVEQDLDVSELDTLDQELIDIDNLEMN